MNSNTLNKVAFLKGNREINPASVRKHKESLKTFKRNLMPIIWVTPQDAEKYTLLDAETLQEIKTEDRNNYEKVIIDGQHRYKAAKELEKSGDKDLEKNLWYQKLELKEGDSLADILREINVTSYKWNGAQYIRFWVMADNIDAYADYKKIFEFADEMSTEGLTAKTINKILFFNEKFSWGKIQNTEKLKTACTNIDRAKEIWALYREFKDTPIYKKPYIIDIMIESGAWKEMADKIKNLTESQREELKNTPVRECEEKLRSLIYK